MNKKGAIELSMTTIVVIVIGITLLSLGLIFVRGIFKQVTGLSDITFREAETSLENMRATDEILSVPPEVKVDIGGQETFKIVLGNDGSVVGDDTFRISITPNEEIANPNIKITLVGKPVITISEGQKASYQVLVDIDDKSSLKPAGFIVTARYGNEVYKEGSFVIFPQAL